MPYRKRRIIGPTDLAAIGVSLSIIVLSLIPGALLSSVVAFLGGDKAGHFIAYGLVGTLALYRRRSLSSALLTAAIILYMGGLIELVQDAFNRTTDLADFFANALGLSLAGIIVTLVRASRRSRRRTSTGTRRSPVSKIA